MKKLILFLTFLFISINAIASVQVLRFPGNNPTRVCTPSDTDPNCASGGGGSSQWTGTAPGDIYYNQGNVGIGTYYASLNIDNNGEKSTKATIIQTNDNDYSTGTYKMPLSSEIVCDNFNDCMMYRGYETQSFNSSTGLPSSFSINEYGGDVTIGHPTRSNILLHGINFTASFSGPMNISGSTSLNFGALSNNILIDSAGIKLQGNVGIGSTNPGQALDVQGTARMTGFALSTNPSSGYVLTSNSVGVGTWMPATAGGGSGTVTSVTLATPNSTLTLGGTNPVTTSGTINADINLTNANTWTGQQIFNTANVGIGSASPGKALDVQGAGRFSSTLTASNLSGTNTGDQDLSGYVPTSRTVNGHALSSNVTVTASDIGLGSVENTALSTWAGSANLMTVGNLTANVGVGSASPGTALDINGTLRAIAVKVRGGASTGFMKADGSIDSTTYSTTTGTVTSIATTSPITGGTITGTGTIGINTTGPWNGVPAGAVAVAPITFNTANGNIGINTTGPWNGIAAGLTGTSPITYNNSTGAIGINTTGTWNGNAVTASSAATLTTPRAINGTNFDGSAAITVTADANTLTNTTLHSTVVSSSLTGLGIVTTGSWSAGNIGIGTTQLQVPLSVMSGNVGIGTWAPTFALQVKGGNIGVGTYTVCTTDGVGCPGGGSGSGTVNSGTANQLPYYASSAATLTGTSAITTNNTNVGIGTTLYNNALSVKSTASIGTSYNGQAAPANGLIVQGNVGIGTWTSLNALDVNGGVSVGTYAGGVTVPSNGIAVSGNVGVGTWVATAPITIVGSGTSNFGSNVGIGTSGAVPNALYVVGTPMFTTGLNIGIGTAAHSRICISGNAIEVCPGG